MVGMWVLRKSEMHVSDSLQPLGLFSPWNSPDQNTGEGSCFLFRGSSQPGDQTQVSHITGRFFTSWATREALRPLDDSIKRHNTHYFLGSFLHAPSGSDACTAGDPGFDPWVRKIPWRIDRLRTPIFKDFPGG